LLELIGLKIAGLALLSGGNSFVARKAPCRDGHKGLLGLPAKRVLCGKSRIAPNRPGGVAARPFKKSAVESGAPPDGE
jgi:hypothetical protein